LGSELLELLKIPLSMMPEVRSSSENYGEVSASRVSMESRSQALQAISRPRSTGSVALKPRNHQEYIWHRLLHATEHWAPRGAVVEPIGDDRRLEESET
jgi:hypothetical protein